MSDIEDRLDRLGSLVDSQQNGIEGIDTVGHTFVEEFVTPGCRISPSSRDRQYDASVKRTLTVVLVVVAAMAGIVVVSGESVGQSTSGSYAGGDGTASSPYQIANWTHLNNTHENLDANFTLADPDGTVVDNQSVGLDAGDATTITLDRATGPSDVGSGSVTVESDDDSATARVTVETEPPEVLRVVEDEGNIEITFDRTVVQNNTANSGASSGTGAQLNENNFTVYVDGLAYDADGDFNVTYGSGTDPNGAGEDVAVTLVPQDSWGDLAPAQNATVRIDAVQADADAGGVATPGNQSVTVTALTLAGGGASDAIGSATAVLQGDTVALRGSPGENLEVKEVGGATEFSSDFGNSTVRAVNTSTYLAGATYRAAFGNSTDQFFNVSNDRLGSVAPEVVSGPSNGSLTLYANGSFTYTPGAEFSGEDSFTYRVSDGSGGTDTATVTITIQPVNDAPGITSAPANASVDEGNSTTLSVTATDPDSDSLAYNWTLAGNGSLNRTSGSVVTYDAPGDLTSDETTTVTVTVDDGTATVATTATLTLVSTNNAPKAANDSYTVTENTTLSVPAPGVLGNDSDPDGDALTASVVSGPSNGTLTLYDNGSFEYTPDPDFDERDAFTYRADDGSGGTDTATVAVRIVPDGSVSLNQTIYTEERGDVAAIGVELTDTDTVTVTIGTTGDNNWAQNVTVEDGNDDDFVTLEFNTYTAGTSDDTYGGGTGYVVYSVADGADTVTNVAPAGGGFDPDSPAADTLSASDYAISAVAGDTPAEQTDDGEDAFATLSLAERSTDAVTTYVAPSARLGDLDSVSAVQRLIANQNVTQASEIVDGDVLLAKIDASGLEGVLRNHTDAAYPNATVGFFIEEAGDRPAWEFRVDQTNPGSSTDAYSATMNVSNTELLADSTNDDYWLVIDTARVEEFSDGDALETNVTTLAEDDVNPDDTTVLDTWDFAAPEATVDTNADIDNDGDVDEVTVQKAAGQEITGTTNVAPGTELTVRVTGTDSGSPFVKPLAAIVQPDGSWSVTADFSGNARGANFTVDVRRGSNSLLDGKIDGRIAAAPTASVTFNDQESFGSTVTVASVTSSDGGFVAIHLHNASGRIIGNSSYIEPGSDSEVDIALNRTLTEDTTLVAMVHQDTDGDESFEFEFGSSVDAPYTENGSAVTDSASITVTGPQPTTTASPTETTTGIMPTTTGIMPTTTGIMSTTTDIMSTMTTTIGGVTSTMTDIVTTTTDMMDTIIDTTTTFVTDPMETTTDIMEGITETMDDMTTTIVNMTTSPVETTTGMIEDIVETTTTGTSPGFGVIVVLVALAFLQLALIIRKELQ